MNRNPLRRLYSKLTRRECSSLLRAAKSRGDRDEKWELEDSVPPSSRKEVDHAEPPMTIRVQTLWVHVGEQSFLRSEMYRLMKLEHLVARQATHDPKMVRGGADAGPVDQEAWLKLCNFLGLEPEQLDAHPSLVGGLLIQGLVDKVNGVSPEELRSRQQERIEYFEPESPSPRRVSGSSGPRARTKRKKGSDEGAELSPAQRELKKVREEFEFWEHAWDREDRW